MLDPDKIRRALRVCRAASAVSRVRGTFDEIKEAVGLHNQQVNTMLNASELAGRILEKRVEPGDVKTIGRSVVQSAPKVCNAIADHIRRHRAKSNAKT